MIENTIYLVDDHPALRKGIRAVFDDSPEFTVVGEAGQLEKAAAEISRLEPNLVFLDLDLGDVSGLGLLDRGDGALPEKTKVICLTMHTETKNIIEAILRGASGFVSKESPEEVLLRAARAAAAGECFLDPGVTGPLFDWMRSIPGLTELTGDPDYNRLPEREKEVFRLLARDLTTAEIAERMCISKKTAANYQSNLMQALGLSSKIELEAYAKKLGIE
jgi:DNA-binding NarL/FixJ family response regulator